jgi:hypothetical protein
MFNKITKNFLLFFFVFVLSGLFNDFAYAEEFNTSLIVADAGPDRFVKVGQEVTFDASFSHVPENIEPIYRWDMGNSEFRFGLRNTYVYNKVGSYRLKLIIEGKNTEFKSIDEAVINVFDDQVLLFSSSDSSSESDVKRLSNIAIKNNIAVDSVRVEDKYPSFIALKQVFINKIVATENTVSKNPIIVLMGDCAMESFFDYYSRSEADLSDKKVIFLTTDAFFNKPRLEIAKLMQNVLDISILRVKTMQEIDDNIFNFEDESIIKSDFLPQKNRHFLGVIDFLYRFNGSLIERGFSLDIVFFLYVMLLISILGLFLRKVLGLSVVSIHILGLTIFSFLDLGVVPSLILFVGFFIVSYLVQRVYETDRETLFSGSFIDMLMMVFFIIVGLSIIKLFASSMHFDIKNFMAVIVISIASRRLARYTIGRTIPRIMGQLLQDVLFLVLNYFLLSTAFVRLNVLAYPEFYVLAILLISILLERYRGLRLMELARFKKLIYQDRLNSDRKEE